MTDYSSFINPSPKLTGSATSLKFGTSGLRGLVSDMIGSPSRAYTLAFARYVKGTAGDTAEILVGRDLRPSSPKIARDCWAAIQFAGLAAITFDNGSTLHYRASGNAPELRCYVEASKRRESEALLAWGLGAAVIGLQSVHIGQQ